MIQLDPHERDILHDYIYLNIIESILQSDYKQFQKTAIEFNQPYLLVIESKLKIVKDKLKEIRAFMQKEGINVFKNQEESDQTFVQYNYYWKNKAEGYSRFWRAGMNVEITNRIKELFI